MVYRLTLKEPVDEKKKDIGENVFFESLPFDYQVYMLYYPSAMPDQALEKKLRELGAPAFTGKNLFINIGRLNDPNYKKIADKFSIKNLPAIIVTAIDELASPPDDFFTAYVRIDSEKLLNSPDRLIKCLGKVFNLFIQRKISEAVKEVKKDKINIFLSSLKDIVMNSIKEIWEFIDERDISVSWIEGKFELKKSGD